MTWLTEFTLTQGGAGMWFAILLIFSLIEVVLTSAICVWFVLGSLGACLTALICPNPWLELAVFLGISILSLVTLRTWAIQWLKIGVEKTNIDSLISQEGIIISEVKPFEPGTLKVEGKVWRCQSLSGRHYQPSEVVTVRKLEGVTLYID